MPQITALSSSSAAGDIPQELQILWIGEALCMLQMRNGRHITFLRRLHSTILPTLPAHLTESSTEVLQCSQVETRWHLSQVIREPIRISFLLLELQETSPRLSTATMAVVLPSLHRAETRTTIMSMAKAMIWDSSDVSSQLCHTT